MTVETIEGNFKLNQHKSDEDHVAVANALAQRDPSAQAIAKRMVALRPHLDYGKLATTRCKSPPSRSCRAGNGGSVTWRRKRKSACSAPPATPARSWCGCCCAIRTSRSRCSPPTAAPGKEMREVFPQFSPFDAAEARVDRERRLDEGGARSRLLRAAARHDAEGDQAICSAKAPKTKVVDLSADFRLPTRPPMRAGTATSTTRRSCRRRRSTAWSRSIAREIKKARLVANPGCYTTCAQLPLMPLLKAKAIEPDEIVIDAKSGMTGAGRAAKEEMLFSEVSEGFHAYGVGHHRHMAELDQEFSQAAGREVVVTFTPHLVPMNRGILSTIYVRGLKAVGPRIFTRCF